MKEAYSKKVVSCISYYKNEEELFSAHLLDDENYDLLIAIKNVEERKIIKYLLSKKSNELKEEIIDY